MPLHVLKDLSHLWQESYMVFCLQITNKFFPCSFRLIHHLSHDHAHPLEQDFYSSRFSKYFLEIFLVDNLSLTIKMKN